MSLIMIGKPVGRLFRRVMLALVKPEPAAKRNLPLESYRFPIF
jgi:hypothetical protein